MSVSRRNFLVTSSIGLAGAMVGASRITQANSLVSNYLIAPGLIAGGGNNYNVWPSGIAEIDQPNVQWAVDNVEDGGFVRLHAQRDVVTGERIPFDFGTGNVQIREKSVVVVGSTQGPGSKPLFIGTAATKIYTDPAGTGVFHIDAVGHEVEIESLEIHHEFTPNPSTFGSVTILNRGCSGLKVTDCEIHTFATSAINSHSKSGAEPFAMQHKVVSGCKVRGYAEFASTDMAGTNSCVNVGSFGGPVDLSGAHFEVTDCNLDSAVFGGVVLFSFECDEDSTWVIAGNTIGHDSVDPGNYGEFPLDYSQATAMGIWVGVQWPGIYNSHPLGTLDILDNSIKLERYALGPSPYLGQAGGIIVDVDYVADRALETTIGGNNIRVEIPRPRPFVLDQAGILYAGTGIPGGEAQSSASISGNSISSAHTPAQYGIALGQTGLTGADAAATGVVVSDNDYTGLSVGPYLQPSGVPKGGYAVYLSPLTTGNAVDEPTLLCADIEGDGSLNTITASGVECS